MCPLVSSASLLSRVPTLTCRIPSALCGLYGIRPSFGRLPYVGAANSMPGQNSIPSVCGPLSGSASSLKLMLKSVLSQQPWLYDPAVVELPWREDQATPPSKVTIGLYLSDGIVAPLPPVRRAFETVKAALTKSGVELIEWQPPSHGVATELARVAFLADGGTDIFHHIGLSGEPLNWRVAELYGNEATTPMPADKLYEYNLELFQFRRDYMDYWNSTAALTASGRPVDAILTPVLPCAGIEFKKAAYIGYTPWVNTLDYTSAVFPVTKVDPAVDVLEEGYTGLNELDTRIHNECRCSVGLMQFLCLWLFLTSARRPRHPGRRARRPPAGRPASAGGEDPRPDGDDCRPPGQGVDNCGLDCGTSKTERRGPEQQTSVL